MKVKWFNVLGVGIGLIGATGLISVSGEGNFVFNMGYAIFIMLATICYATNVNVLKKYLKKLDAITITSVSFLIIGIPSTAYLLMFTDFISQLSTDKLALTGLGYMAILAIMGTGIALVVFNYLIKIASPLFAASVTYLIPIVAVMWGGNRW